MKLRCHLTADRHILFSSQLPGVLDYVFLQPNECIVVGMAVLEDTFVVAISRHEVLE